MRTLSVFVIILSVLTIVVLSIVMIGWMVGDIVFEQYSTVVLLSAIIFGNSLSFALGIAVYFWEHRIFCTPPDARHCRKIIDTDFDCETCKWKTR